MKQMNDYNSMLLFVSDHSESLGRDLYMHGTPISIAPKNSTKFLLLFGCQIIRD